MKFNLVENLEKFEHTPGSIEWEANEGRKKRISRYRELANLEEDFTITEDNIEEWAFNRTCNDTHCSPDRLKSELLGIKWSDYEKDED